MAQQNVTELDFDNIKTNLKTFLKDQSEFTDYNFEGSGFGVLLDLLAYNTHYNGLLAHMLANESFLDSAIKRESVVSLAKAIGYMPRSRRSASATITFDITADPAYSSTTLTLPRDAVFTGTLDGTSYNFCPSTDVTINASSVGGVTHFVFTDLVLREGVRVSNQFTVQTGVEQGPYVIPNVTVDTTTIRVRVQNSLSDLTLTTWSKADTFLDVKSDTKSYWIEEGADGNYQIRFGDNVIGKKLDTGNLIIIDYVTGSGEAANGVKTFTSGTTYTGSNETKTVTTSSATSGGAFKERIDEIRFNAPRYNATRERAVTSSDYESLILASNPNIESVSVWGGEKNDPPMYGKVFISLNPTTGTIITAQDKDNITNSIIDPKTPVSIIPEFVDPEYTYVGVNTSAVYDPKVTTLTSGEIGQAMTSSISEYFTTSLNKLNKSFYYSRLHDLIKSSSDSILSVNIQTHLQKRPTVVTGTLTNYTVRFNTKLQPRELTSTLFDITLSGVTHTKCSLADLPGSTVVAPLYNGTGVVNAVDTSGNIIAAVGTIDYDAGTIEAAINISALYGSETVLRVNVTPHDSAKDVTTQALVRTSDTSTAAVVAKPSRNTVLALDNTVVSNTTKALSGVKVAATPEVEEI